MTREIKFRAWDKRFKRMDSGSGDLLLRINSKDFSEPMQFTGLLDKNGKEIYEGDVVVLWKGEHREGTYEVVFREGSFGYGDKINPFHDHMPYDEHENVEYAEIIGNIYENKDLLK